MRADAGIGPDKAGADLPPGKYKICRVLGVLYYRRVWHDALYGRGGNLPPAGLDFLLLR